MADKTWPEWRDMLGRIYRPGDIVAIATVSGKSPQLVLGQVERINRINSKGEEITESYLYWPPGVPEVNDRGWPNYKESQRRTRPSCTVTVTPVADARKFYRSRTPEGAAKKVTYQFPQNIVRVEVLEDD